MKFKIGKYRFYSQVIFAAIVIWIGVEFHLFVKGLESGYYFNRPPGVEAFLPISALMSVYHFILSGEIHQYHPAGFFIFIAIVTLSFLFGKAFCSWVCPIGFISEMVGEFGEKVSKKLFGRIIFIPRFLDYILRPLKYFLLGFFIWAIFFAMTPQSLKTFLDSPYNAISDVKMYIFFAEISQTSIIVLTTLFVLSIFIRNFWCRYLCPYGALLGIIGLLSPNKITRNEDTCTDCKACTKVCPSRIKVHKVKRVFSDECTSCYSCIDACPVKDTLEIKTPLRKKINRLRIPFYILLIYFTIVLIAIISGNWKNNIDIDTYEKLYKQKNSIGHIRSKSDIDRLNKRSE